MANPSATFSNKIASSERKKVARARKSERERLLALAAAADQDRRAEQIAPRHARTSVVDGSGRVVRGALVVVDGAIVRRASVLDRLRTYGEEREARGLASMITSRRVDAATRLQVDHAEVGQGIGVAACDYSRQIGLGTADGSNTAVLRQIAARKRLEEAVVWLGSAMDIIAPVVLDGVDVRSWAEARRLDRQQAVGYLAAALERLAEYYDRLTKTTGSASRVRSAEVGQPAHLREGLFST